jgi:hypothetical protein
MSEFRRKNRERVEEKFQRKKLDRDQAELVRKDLNADKRQPAPVLKPDRQFIEKHTDAPRTDKELRDQAKREVVRELKQVRDNRRWERQQARRATEANMSARKPEHRKDRAGGFSKFRAQMRQGYQKDRDWER